MTLHIRGSGSAVQTPRLPKYTALLCVWMGCVCQTPHTLYWASVGGVPCDIVDDNLELCDTLTREKVTCRSKAKLVGPMNVTVCVTGRGASEVTKIGRYLDSQDRLYQFLTYAGHH
ncbi:uncharacterized protein LOC135109525 isoform X2 [Scylla paramamosain]|uniref:uncharacterized protein LOC135109525 isoform X2 n=1 Tax=Scylla paramamosain TaxID=85552 RepID=UPI0030829F05